MSSFCWPIRDTFHFCDKAYLLFAVHQILPSKQNTFPLLLLPQKLFLTLLHSPVDESLDVHLTRIFEARHIIITQYFFA